MGTDSKTAFQLGTESLGKILHPRKHTEKINADINGSRAFLETFNLSLGRSIVYLGDSASSELLSLVDEARFSDPISCEACSDSEALLEDVASQIESAAENGICDSELVSKARKYLAVRNQACQLGK